MKEFKEFLSKFDIVIPDFYDPTPLTLTFILVCIMSIVAIVIPAVFGFVVGGGVGPSFGYILRATFMSLISLATLTVRRK